MRIEINRREISIYNEEGEYMDGDVRVISEDMEKVFEVDTDDIELADGDVIAAAVSYTEDQDVQESSMDPIPDEIGENAWLSGRYTDPYTNSEWETTIRVLDCTPSERAQIFRKALGK